MSRGSLRLLVIADSDSYLKWGAALASRAPDGWSTDIVLVETPVAPSGRQCDAALSGSRFVRADLRSIAVTGIAAFVDDRRFDAVLLAVRGPLVRVIAPLLGALTRRPVIASGFPGITIPAVPKAVIYREQCDLIVLHSRREVRDFESNARALGLGMSFGLATLPFLPSGAALRRDGALVFAVQAKVPAGRDERVRLLGMLADAARARPAMRVIVKVRARTGEEQTHAEEFDLAALLRDTDIARRMGGVPGNLVVADGPIAEHLAGAAALATVSSTAALEAIASGVPVLLLDDFGIEPRLINTVFEGSGLFGSAADLAASDWRHPEPSWLDDNYFHPASDDDWHERLGELVARNRVAALPLAPRRHNRAGGALRRAFERKRMLGPHDRTLIGAASLVVALPARWALRRARRLQRMLQPG